MRRACLIILLLLCGRVGFCADIRDAVWEGDVETVTAILDQHPALVSGKDNAGLTPLHWAVSRGNLEMVKLLLGAKADVNARANDGWTPLHEAEDEDVAELLLARGAGVNAASSLGKTPLHAAAARGNRDVVALLLAHGGEMNAKDKAGNTPVHAAVENGHADVVALLLAHGADCAIGDAAWAGDIGKLNALLKGQPDLVSSKDAAGNTALHWAALGGSAEAVQALLAAKADPNAANSDGDTALHLALNGAVARALLAGGADVNARNKLGRTPLHMAADKGRPEVAQALLAGNAEVNAKDNLLETPYHRAAFWGRQRVVELLRDHGGSE
jgi:ankyrin repeat protein